MQWLDGPPTEPGYYWYQLADPISRVPVSKVIRGPAQVHWSCVYLTRHKKHTRNCKLVQQSNETGAVEVSRMHRRWAGPLPVPSED